MQFQVLVSLHLFNRQEKKHEGVQQKMMMTLPSNGIQVLWDNSR